MKKVSMKKVSMTTVSIKGGIAALLFGLGLAGPAATADESIVELLRKVDDLLQGDSSHGTMTMRVRTKRFERELTMETWSRGSEKSLIRILEPAKEKGTATLKVEDKIWNYLPKVDRTIKVPASMMAASWMGSHFTNDDLVRQSRYSEDFECSYEEDTVEHWLIACVPHDDAPVVWGKVTVRIDKAERLPQETRFYDEDLELVRTMIYEDVGELAGRRLPRSMRVIPAEEEGEFTQILYRSLEIDVEVPESVFTLRFLKR